MSGPRVDVYGYPVWPGSPSYSYSEDQAIERPSRGVSSTSSLQGESEMEKSMTFGEFSKVNRDRCESPNGFNHALSSWSLSDWFTAVAGELGEAANVAKKLNRIRDGIPGNKESADELRDKLKREIADTFIYLDLLAQSEGFQIGDVVMDVFDAKSAEIGYLNGE